jgi:hypothetical protein
MVVHFHRFLSRLFTCLSFSWIALAVAMTDNSASFGLKDRIQNAGVCFFSLLFLVFQIHSFFALAL